MLLFFFSHLIFLYPFFCRSTDLAPPVATPVWISWPLGAWHNSLKRPADRRKVLGGIKFFIFISAVEPFRITQDNSNGLPVMQKNKALRTITSRKNCSEEAWVQFSREEDIFLIDLADENANLSHCYWTKILPSNFLPVAVVYVSVFSPTMQRSGWRSAKMWRRESRKSKS